MSFTRILFFGLFLSSFVAAEVVTMVAPNRNPNSGEPIFSSRTITLEEGDTATTLFLSNFAFLDVTVGNILVRIDANDADQANLPVVAGPATIRLANFTTANAALATMSIKRADDVAEVPVTTQTVVIPDDGSGDRNVALESSTDMVNWVATTPGLFRSEDLNRFFRVRITKTESAE